MLLVHHGHDPHAVFNAEHSNQDSDQMAPGAPAETWNPFSLLMASEDDDVDADVDDASDAEGSQQQDEPAAGPSGGSRRNNRRKKKRSNARQARSQRTQEGSGGQAPQQPAPHQQARASLLQRMPQAAASASASPYTTTHVPQPAGYHQQRSMSSPLATALPAAAHQPQDLAAAARQRAGLSTADILAMSADAPLSLTTRRQMAQLLIREVEARAAARNAARPAARAAPHPGQAPHVPIPPMSGAALPWPRPHTAARPTPAGPPLPPPPGPPLPPAALTAMYPPSSVPGAFMAAAPVAAVSTSAARAAPQAASSGSSWLYSSAPHDLSASTAAPPAQPSSTHASSSQAGGSSAPAAAPAPGACSSCSAAAAEAEAAAEQPECWVCFSHGNDEDVSLQLQLISPCQVCSGAMAHIHRGCFRKWLAASWSSSCPNCARKYDRWAAGRRLVSSHVV
jgi:hypothetical protein